MCGISGWIGPDAGLSAEALRDGLHHRGPDGSGIWRGQAATLVHNRLAIIDLSEAGAQPMVYNRSEEALDQSSSFSPQLASKHRSSTVLVFNGEIYNHRELRVALEAAGEVFLGHSDTEVLMRLLVREGAACLEKLAGMFAFCFWDEASGEALMARDAYGIKPLYFRHDGTTLSFASEAMVLQFAGDSVDADALRDFFLWGSVPEPATLKAAVRQIPAGHLLRWKDGKAEIKQWHPVFRENSKFMSLTSAATLTRAALIESMRRHLVGDVPVGIFLSGGIDSTVILALARLVLGPGADIRTFSIGFDDPIFDESSLARRSAAHFGSRHTEWIMTPEEGAREVPPYLEAVDQPTVDGFNIWCVSKLARREGMKVVLTGLGGDEWFAGYSTFQRIPQLRRFHYLLGPFRQMVAGLLEFRPTGSPWKRLASFLRGNGSWLEAYHAQRGIFTAQEASRLAQDLTGLAPSPSVWDMANLPSNPQAAVGHLELTRYMRNQLLRDCDVFSMAQGLELRVPFVDVRLAETLLLIPSETRLRQGKKLLLESVPEVPDWISNRPKRGFSFPFEKWIGGQFGVLLAEAKGASPVELGPWYRVWAVAMALRNLKV